MQDQNEINQKDVQIKPINIKIYENKWLIIGLTFKIPSGVVKLSEQFSVQLGR